MKSFVEEMTRPGIPQYCLRSFLADRDERFRDGNDKTWGVGNWVRCDRCLDTLGYPAYHHKDHHEL